MLEVDGRVLFESAVIMKYLDEVNPPSLHPGDAFARAQDRAWIEFSSNLLVLQYQLSHTPKITCRKKSSQDCPVWLTICKRSGNAATAAPIPSERETGISTLPGIELRYRLSPDIMAGAGFGRVYGQA